LNGDCIIAVYLGSKVQRNRKKRGQIGALMLGSRWIG